MKTLLYALIAICAITASAQQTVGLFKYDQAKSFNGLTLFCPSSSTITYLLDNCGRVINTWKSKYTTGHSVYLLTDGSIVRAGNSQSTIFKGGGSGGMIERIGWDGTMIWQYQISNDTMCQHHDIYPMANGNVMMVVWDRKTIDQAKAMGRVTVITDMWSEKIIEVKPTGPTSGEIVWEWRLWDHLVQDVDNTKPNYGKLNEHPERMNINFSTLPIPDWVHYNGMDYNPELDQIIMSVHTPSELWIIDHSTTTAEAATSKGGKSGKGGDLLYRWGNPAIYNAGTVADQRMTAQHHAHWIPKGFTDAGNIMIFNNRAGGSGATVYSSLDIIAPPIDSKGNYTLSGNKYGPDSAYWRYFGTPLTDFYSQNLSSGQRLPNGNTYICMGASGTFIEITPEKEIVWKYISPIKQGVILKQGDSISANPVFRSFRYPYDYLKGKTLVGGNPIELQPLPSNCQLPTSVDEDVTPENTILTVTPNPASTSFTVSFTLDMPQRVSLQVYDVLGKVVGTIVNGELESGHHTYPFANSGTGTLYVRLSCAQRNNTIPVKCTGE